MKNNPLTILFLTIFTLVSYSPVLFSAPLSQQTLQNDLNYYRKTAGKQNLNTNDRRYILLRIKEKYEGIDIDLSALETELARVEGKQYTAAANTGKVEKIFVSETENDSRVVITATGVKRSNYFLMRDPDPDLPPKVILDLYGVKDKLSNAARNITTKSGIFSYVESGQFENEPDNIVRISAQMRENRPYKVITEGNQWVIISEKAGTKKQAAETKKISETTATSVPATVKQTKKSESENYRVEAGDVLGVTIYPAEELSRETVVQPDGKLSFPLIGSAEAQGLTIKQLEESMAKELDKYISSPQVSITVRKFSRRQIFVVGEVRSVGAFNYKENLRLMEFISSLGGFTNDANRREIKVYRGPPTQRQTHIVNVEQIIQSGDFSKDFLLEAGDIIEVKKGTAMKVALLGDVESPGYYDHRDNLHLLELISLAGGFTDTANIAKVSIVRSPSEQDKKVLKVNMKSILLGSEKDVPILPGDMVYVPKKSLATANWFITNVMPWISLATLVVALRAF